MRRRYFSTLWLLLALLATGCLHARVRRVQSIPPGEYATISSTARVPKTHSGWTFVLSPTRAEVAPPLSGQAFAEALDLGRTYVSVRVSNISEVSTRVTGWQGGSMTLAPNQRATVWAGTYTREAPEYPLFWTRSDRDTKLEIEVLFQPAIKTQGAVILKMVENPL